MAHVERRPLQHVMEDESVKVLQGLLPKEWVIRPYHRDYGIDYVIELFNYVDRRRCRSRKTWTLRSAIQQIVLEHRRRYGYRRVSAELRRREMLANHKRVARIMREDRLLAVQPRQFVVTTDSDHELEVYLNLARRMKLTGVDQLWVADITYIRLPGEFVYLAVILDAFSRKVGLGTGANTHEPVGRVGLGTGHCKPAATARSYPSLGSWSAVCVRRIRGDP